MKVMGSFVFGHHARNLVPGFGDAKLRELRQAALRWALRDDRITTLLVGMTRPADVDDNVKTLRGDRNLTPEDQELLAEFTSQAFRAKAIKDMDVT